MNEYIYDVANIISTLSNAYQSILQITGTNPDTGRDYDFISLIPDTISDLANCAVELDRIYNSLVEVTGATRTAHFDHRHYKTARFKDGDR